MINIKNVYCSLFTVVTITSFTACGGSNSSSPEPNTPTHSSNLNRFQPNLFDTWQWQLSGELNDSYSANIYDLDLFDVPNTTIASLKSRGHRIICYISTGSWEEWRVDANTFPQDALGNVLAEWEGERWLDIRNQQVRRNMITRFDLAAEKGCDAIEPDNIDGYLNDTGFDLTAEDQLEYNRFLAEQAHERNLSIALKNDISQAHLLVEYFDFAINEQCFELNECDKLKPFIDAGKPVFNAEYHPRYVENEEERAELCLESINLQFSTLILPRNLDDEFRYSCL